jgi:hypothetical protein
MALCHCPENYVARALLLSPIRQGGPASGEEEGEVPVPVVRVGERAVYGPLPRSALDEGLDGLEMVSFPPRSATRSALQPARDLPSVVRMSITRPPPLHGRLQPHKAVLRGLSGAQTRDLRRLPGHITALLGALHNGGGSAWTLWSWRWSSGCSAI